MNYRLMPQMEFNVPKIIDISYFCDTEGKIWQKNLINDGAGGWIEQPILIDTILGSFQPFDGTKELSAGQPTITATDVFYTNVNPLTMNGDFMIIGSDEYGSQYEIVNYHEPVNIAIGGYYAIFLKEIIT